MRTVLVVRLDSAGDVLLAGPAVRAVAAQADRVVLLAGPRGRAAACRALIGDLAAARQAGMAARTRALRRYGLGRFPAEWDRLLAAAGAG